MESSKTMKQKLQHETVAHLWEMSPSLFILHLAKFLLYGWFAPLWGTGRLHHPPRLCFREKRIWSKKLFDSIFPVVDRIFFTSILDFSEKGGHFGTNGSKWTCIVSCMYISLVAMDLDFRLHEAIMEILYVINQRRE